MPGYPIAHTEHWETFDPCAMGSPYESEEIKEYLRSAGEQFSSSDNFEVVAVEFLISRSLTSRRFWLWKATDDRDREWMIVVGSGASPFVGEARNIDRWIYAQTDDDDLAPDAFLDREIAQHP